MKQIPYGKVVSYGQITRMLGRPRAAHEVGWAMRCCPDGLPWQRVVMADGSITGGLYAEMRRSILESEGVVFLPDGRVDMEMCRWEGGNRPVILHQAFPPLYEGKPRVLILGTFPSPMSREKCEYYGNPRNQFWKIIFGVFDLPFITPDYCEKKAVLAANGIAVWDVVTQCTAVGALDSDLLDIVYNTELPEFIKRNGICTVFFNGNNAYTFYKRGIGDIERNILPSTSPAHAAMKFDEKLRIWHDALGS